MKKNVLKLTKQVKVHFARFEEDVLALFSLSIFFCGDCNVLELALEKLNASLSSKSMNFYKVP